MLFEGVYWIYLAPERMKSCVVNTVLNFRIHQEWGKSYWSAELQTDCE
jgi:hypothetical protein